MMLTRKKSKNDALPKRFKKRKNISAFRKRGNSAFPTNEIMIQRKPHCACGGGCPSCQAVHELEEAVQPKLKINEPNDKYEKEADAVADRIMRMPEEELQRVPSIQMKCQKCEEEQKFQKKPLMMKSESNNGQASISPTLYTRLSMTKGNGISLPPATNEFMSRTIGADFSNVRIHTGDDAVQMNQKLQARAFTFRSDIYFNRGEYNPETPDGKRLLGHELTHVMQQEKGLFTHNIQRQLSPSDCSSDCEKEDGKGVATGKYSITIFADKEGPFLLLPLTHKVGHSWLRLEDDKGRYWTYGFWPQEGYDPSNIRAPVKGCVHHPDTSHKPTASQKFELNVDQFTRAYNVALNICRNKPEYNLFDLQCTEFVNRILVAAGKGSFGGFGLILESPNALNSWIRTHSLILGTGVTFGNSSPSGIGAGLVGANLTYRLQFYSLLGEKLRFYGLGRAELSTPIKSLTTGAGIELNPQKIWIPTPFVEGGASIGDLTATPETSAFGAGFTGMAGLRFNIDEIGFIGLEYNIIKNIVNEDPVLQRLMLSAGVRLF